MFTALVINENKTVHTNVKKKFKGLLTVQSAVNGYEGLKMLSFKYDIIFLDLVMEDMNGYEVIDNMTIKERKKTVVLSEKCKEGKVMVALIRKGIRHYVDSIPSIYELKSILRYNGLLRKVRL